MAIDFTKSYPVIEWDLNNYHFFTKYFGKKEENAKGFKVQIMQDGEVLTPTTETLRIYCKKKDGNGVYIDSSTVVDTYYIINLTNQVYSVVGLVECELQLNSNNKWLYSPTFGINVDDNLVDGSIVSSNDFIALQNALSKVDNFDDLYASRLNALETSKIDKANIANNLVTTTTGLVLDASQGKNLQDQVTTINNNLAVQTWADLSLYKTADVASVGIGSLKKYGKVAVLSVLLTMSETVVNEGLFRNLPVSASTRTEFIATTGDNLVTRGNISGALVSLVDAVPFKGKTIVLQVVFITT